MKALAIGSIVESVCGKCDDVMGHTIMAMVGSEIVKVECRVCKSQHRYRPPARVSGEKTAVTMKKGRDGVPIASGRAAMDRTTRSVALNRSRKSSAAMAAALASLTAWENMARDHGGETPRPYAMAESFAVGDFLSHPTFGLGGVTGLVPPDKMDVLFETGVKRLLRGKA
jgi:hypothetical protein